MQIKRDANALDAGGRSPVRAARHKVFTTKNIVMIAMFGAIAGVLMVFDFSVPIAPSFMKIDLGDLPAILGTFMMGPVEGVLITIVKLLIKLVLKGTSTAFVGELSNLVVASAYLLPAALVYRFKKGKGGAILSLGTGTLVVSMVAVLSNYFVMFPLYSNLYGMPMEAIIGMGTAINGHITNLFTMMLFAVLPFNLLKYTIVSVITFLVYKRLKHILYKE